MKNVLLSLLGLSLIASCATPLQKSEGDQIRSIVASVRAEVGAIREDMSSLNGKIEESEYRGLQRNEKMLELVNQKSALMEAKIETLEDFSKNQTKINLGLLESINGQKELLVAMDANVDDVKFTHYKVLLDHANKQYRQKRWREALISYDKILEHKKTLSKKDFELLSYRQALINYRIHNFDTAMHQFATFVLTFKDSYKSPSSLYHLGKIFIKMKKFNEAEAAFEEILKKHPDRKKWVSLAKKYIKKLKEKTNKGKIAKI